MRPSEVTNERILISPLNWGMGHVSRCIGLINQLLDQDNEIFIACDKFQKEVFLEYFPNLTYINHEGYPFEFGGDGNFSWDILWKISSLKSRLKEERKQTEEYVSQYAISLVLSDHRYGFKSKKVRSVFITHQFNLPLKWYEIIVARTHRKLMFSFGHIWIMDEPDFKFAGKLSVSGGETQVTYIGAYSRFKKEVAESPKSIENVLIISGPQVYGQQLLNEQISVLIQEGLVVIASDEIEIPDGVKRSGQTWREKDAVIHDAKHIISRSGYSTIMDLHFLNTPSTLIATNGQREQEYLKEYHS